MKSSSLKEFCCPRPHKCEEEGKEQTAEEEAVDGEGTEKRQSEDMAMKDTTFPLLEPLDDDEYMLEELVSYPVPNNFLTQVSENVTVRG